ncbi:MAG: hypothetical protein PVF33_00745 [Candidatus Latescibacterota bacterium]|jgi:hypothetical protein
MKYKLNCVLALVLACVLVSPPVAFGQDGLQLMPADTPGIFTINSIEKLYETFGVDDLRTQYPDQFLQMKEEMIEELGVDLLDLQSLRQFGFDPAKPVHVGFAVDPAFATIVAVPSTGDAGGLARSLMEREAGDFTKKSQAQGVDIFGDEEGEAAYFAKDSYVVFVLTDEDEGGIPAVESAEHLLAAASKGTLAKSKDYKRVFDKIPGEADVTFYMGPGLYEKLLESHEYGELEEDGISPEELQALNEKWGISDMKMVAKGRLESASLVVESYTWANKDSKVMGWYRTSNDPTAFLARVPSDPMLAFVARMNFAALWESLQDFDEVVESDSIPDFDDMFDDASEDLGIDVVNGLIKQLDGNVALLVNSVQMMSNDAVVLLQLSDPDAFRTTMTALVEEIDASIEVNPSEDSGKPNPELLREEFNGVPYYTFVAPPMVEVSFGVVEDHLVVTASKQRFTSIVKGGKSFIYEIGNKEVEQALESRTGNAFYMDFQKVAANLQMWAPMLGEESFEIVETLQQLKELVGVSRLEDDGFWQKMTLTGAQPGIWKRLLEAGIKNMPEDLDIDLDDEEEGYNDEG